MHLGRRVTVVVNVSMPRKATTGSSQHGLTISSDNDNLMQNTNDSGSLSRSLRLRPRTPSSRYAMQNVVS